MIDKAVDREWDKTVDEAAPEFMSGMVDDLEYITRNERIGRANRLKRKRGTKWLLPIASGILVLIVVLATAFDNKKPGREDIKSLESSLGRIEKRLEALETKIPGIEKSMAPGLLEKKVASTKSRSRDQYHIVRSGDNLSAIAAKYGITVDVLCRLNRLTVEEPIKPDQKLLVSPN